MGMPLWKVMSERLSPQGSDLLILCDNAARAVACAIKEMAGTPAGGQMVKMGADGTPTKQIDRAAENAVLDTLRASGLGFKVLSEEIGEVLIGEKPDYFLHLDPLDGTFNAIAGIPFYSVSIYLSKDDFHFGYISDLAAETSAIYAEAGRGAYSRAERAPASLVQCRPPPFQHLRLHSAAPYRQDRDHRRHRAPHSHLGQHRPGDGARRFADGWMPSWICGA